MKNMEEIVQFVEILDVINSPFRHQWTKSATTPSEDELSVIHLFRITDILQFSFSETECILIEEILGGGHGIIEFIEMQTGITKKTVRMKNITPALHLIEQHLAEHCKNRNFRLPHGWNARKIRKKYIFK